MKLQPFRNMEKIKINNEENCLMGNRCFVKIGKVRRIPNNSKNTSEPVLVRNHYCTLLDLLYSPFHFQQPQIQYVMPRFVLTCIDEAVRNKKTCRYCIDSRGEEDSLNMNIFIPTLSLTNYIIIGLRIKYFWSSKFEIE